MTLSRKIADAVESLSAGGELPRIVQAEAGPHRLSLNLNAHGPVGIAFENLDFASADQADRSADGLRAWGDRLAARLTYLMEPLIVLEVDAEAGQAELRSQAPTPRANQSSYYEVRLRRDSSLTLRRISIDQATRRRMPIPCQMTVEVLDRLADDLVASLV
ncbi:hypothetical protein P12x_002548 [Tundrisphaera lichenicola]|uniref:hypothetical protein n=1 Tax=Tundrisphaera lichenicola TaxID=2029860 RepID=UPI003EBA7039